MSVPITTADSLTEWLYHAPPVGLVLGPNIIREEGLAPPPQSAVDNAAVAALLRDTEDGSALADPWAFVSSILGWEARYVAGAPGGPDLPATLTVPIREHDAYLSPDWAVRDLGTPDGFQILVKIYPNLDADQRGALAGWEASPHQQLERLLRDTGVTVGVLVDRAHIRIVYAPRGETSGWQSLPLRSLAEVAGRPMLGGLKLLLGHARLFTEPEGRRLPKLLARSREAQNKVSEELAEQVLGALHELLRAFHAADPARVEALVASNPHHLYEGLLTTLLRLVFLLYAEDRGLLPTKRENGGEEIYERSYSVSQLYARLAQDRALNPDTMDERVGAWGQLLALFRLVHGGHRSGWITPRGGKLFDPNAFPFLEGRNEGQPLGEAKVLPIRDGAILRVLEGLMTLEAKTISGERVRERLSYRSLDVEQIGSVYETVMGFTVMRAPSPMIAVKGEKSLPVFIEIEPLANATAANRQKLLKAAGVAPSAGRLAAIKDANGVETMTAALAAIVDERGSPGGHVAPAGAPVLQPTDERRRTGSHYTPRSLTQPIVRHALEPTFERIGDAATPDQILEIKVCDPACGSGAFLVEACRQLGVRLEKAWAHHPQLKPAIPPDEDDEIHARRLVAQRCLYGVDKNPMAVDLARLSLWLATLAREHEFTFLDHAIKSGDSLVGLTKAQIEAAHWDTSKPPMALLGGLVKSRVNEVVTGRREIQFASDDVKRAIQEARYRQIEQRLQQPRAYGDAVIAAFFSADKPREREMKRAEVESLLAGGGTGHWEKIAAIASTLKRGEHPIAPFHWELEFPEVFARDNPGFDAIVGNPPFAGKNTTISANRKGFLDWLKVVHPGAHGNSDLVAHFFRRAFALLREEGTFGLIATKTIRQGDTRDTGLAVILAEGGQIIRAVRRRKWPGEATVVVSMVHALKGLGRVAILDGKSASRISAYLVDGQLDVAPARLCANARTAFQGSVLLGVGFTFDDSAAAKGEAETIETMRALVDAKPSLASRIRPLIGGDEVTSDPLHRPNRFAIDFFDLPLRRSKPLKSWLEMSEREKARCRTTGEVPLDYHDDVASDYPELLDIVRTRVKPERDGQSRPALRDRWWQYAEKRPGLYRAITKLPSVFVNSSKATPHHAFARLPRGMIYTQNLNVFALTQFSAFCSLSSRVHETWSRFLGTTIKTDLTYVKDDCFETFPFTHEFLTDSTLERAGALYHEFRAELMMTHNIGMTKTYNRFHDAIDNSIEIKRLRQLHADMDRVVLTAYGWRDLAEVASPVFLNQTNEDDESYQGRLFWDAPFREEVLARLLKLNAERYEEELRQGVKNPADADDEGEQEATEEEAAE